MGAPREDERRPAAGERFPSRVRLQPIRLTTARSASPAQLKSAFFWLLLAEDGPDTVRRAVPTALPTTERPFLISLASG